MTYQVRTSNRGWTDYPDVFASMVPPVVVQYDASIESNTYRLFYNGEPIDKTRRIGEHSVSEIRRRVQEHAAARATRVEEVAPKVKAGDGGQMVLVL